MTLKGKYIKPLLRIGEDKSIYFCDPIEKKEFRWINGFFVDEDEDPKSLIDTLYDEAIYVVKYLLQYDMITIESLDDFIGGMIRK